MLLTEEEFLLSQSCSFRLEDGRSAGLPLHSTPQQRGQRHTARPCSQTLLLFLEDPGQCSGVTARPAGPPCLVHMTNSRGRKEIERMKREAWVIKVKMEFWEKMEFREEMIYSGTSP